MLICQTENKFILTMAYSNNEILAPQPTQQDDTSIKLNALSTCKTHYRLGYESRILALKGLIYANTVMKKRKFDLKKSFDIRNASA